MWARFYCCLFLFVVILSLDIIGVYSTRPFLPNHGNNQDPAVQNHNSMQITRTSSNELKGMGSISKEVKYKEIKKIGSRPPSCDHKCYGCMPCEAIQVPTTTNHVGVLYTNYEPEGWKCKCGPTFYTP